MGRRNIISVYFKKFPHTCRARLLIVRNECNVTRDSKLAKKQKHDPKLEKQKRDSKIEKNAI